MGGRRGFTLVEVVLVLTLIATLSSLAIPLFLNVQQKSRQSEVKANLQALHTAQTTYYLEKSIYAVRMGLLAFEPERGNRFAYFLAPGMVQLRDVANVPACASCAGIGVDTFKHGRALAVDEPTGWVTPTTLLDGPGVGGDCPVCEYMAEAAGQMDEDRGLDIWSISSAGRSHRLWGGCSPGQALHERDDTVLP